MSSRRASGDHITPNSGASNEAYLVAGSPSEKKPRMLLTYDPYLEIFTAAFPDPDTADETFEVLQTVDSNGQGYYLHCKRVEDNEQGYYVLCKNMRLQGSFRTVLVKYLGGRNEIIRQFRDNFGDGVSEDVAKQILLAEDEKNPDREIRFARELDHENIVRILGFISPDSSPRSINAIIMEGDFDGSLDAYLKKFTSEKKQFPLQLVKAFALQLASALEYCHSLDIMHRDVRARNIYVQDGNRIKLGNFGYARVGNKDDNHTANKGEELYYRAPEMISSHAITEYTFSVDVYGFALVLWSMLHGGRQPYEDDPACKKLMKNKTKFKQHLVEGNRPGIDKNVDQGLANLIEKCWINETEAYRRPPMSEVVEALDPKIFPKVTLME